MGICVTCIRVTTYVLFVVCTSEHPEFVRDAGSSYNTYIIRVKKKNGCDNVALPRMECQSYLSIFTRGYPLKKILKMPPGGPRMESIRSVTPPTFSLL